MRAGEMLIMRRLPFVESETGKASGGIGGHSTSTRDRQAASGSVAADDVLIGIG